MWGTSTRRVTTPEGQSWLVCRRWYTGRMASWSDRVRATADAGSGVGDVASVFDGGDIVDGIIVAVLAIAVLLILVPILLFGIELIIVGIALAVGLVGRFVFRQPWAVQALPIDGDSEARTWKIVGWRSSGEFVNEVALDLERGNGLPGRGTSGLRGGTPVQ
jgi:hypothetical protein